MWGRVVTIVARRGGEALVCLTHLTHWYGSGLGFGFGLGTENANGQRYLITHTWVGWVRVWVRVRYRPKYDATCTRDGEEVLPSGMRGQTKGPVDSTRGSGWVWVWVRSPNHVGQLA